MFENKSRKYEKQIKKQKCIPCDIRCLYNYDPKYFVYRHRTFSLRNAAGPKNCNRKYVLFVLFFIVYA